MRPKELLQIIRDRKEKKEQEYLDRTRSDRAFEAILGGFLRSRNGEIEITNPKSKKSLAITRLYFIHDFIREKMSDYFHPKAGPYLVESLLDYGTHNAFAVRIQSLFAHHITTFDMNKRRIEQAKKREEVQALLENKKEKRLNLKVMRAQDVNYNSQFDLVTIVEVFGAGFRGKEKDIETVLTKAYKALKPAGVLAVTMRGLTSELADSHEAGLDEKKEIPVYRNSVSPLLDNLFGQENIKWYGQNFTEFDELGHPKRDYPAVSGELQTSGLEHIIYKRDDFIPRESRSYVNEDPQTWIAFCQKPAEPAASNKSIFRFIGNLRSGKT